MKSSTFCFSRSRKYLGHGQARQGHPHAGSGRLVHLAEDQGRLFNDPRLGHLPPEVVALAGALPHAGEDGVAAVLGGDVVDQLLDEHRLAHAGAAEQADLSAFGVGGQQVDDLDTGLEDVHHGALVLERGGLAVNRPLLAGLHRPLLVDGVAQDVEHAAQHALAHGDGDGRAGGGDGHAAAQALAGGEHDAAHRVAAHMLGHLHDLPAAVQLHLQSLLQLRQGAAVKGHVHHGAHDLYNGSLLLTHNGKIPFRALVCSVYPLSVGRYRAAWAPPTTSVISWVMAAWRARLKDRFRRWSIARALSLDDFMAVMRAFCSEQ